MVIIPEVIERQLVRPAFEMIAGQLEKDLSCAAEVTYVEYIPATDNGTPTVRGVFLLIDSGWETTEIDMTIDWPFSAQQIMDQIRGRFDDS